MQTVFANYAKRRKQAWHVADEKTPPTPEPIPDPPARHIPFRRELFSSSSLQKLIAAMASDPAKNQRFSCSNLRSRSARARWFSHVDFMLGGSSSIDEGGERNV